MMRLALAFAAVLACAAPARADTPRIAVGAQLGIPFPIGVEGVATVERYGQQLSFDVDWQPSAYWQSYSIGAALHPLHNAFLVGLRARWLQLHPPWSRGYDGEFDNQLGLGVEIGGRWWIRDRVLIGVSGGANLVPSGDADLPIVYTLTIEAAVRVGG